MPNTQLANLSFSYRLQIQLVDWLASHNYIQQQLAL